MKLSRLVNPDRKKHTLAAICESVDHSYVGSHRATPDAAMAAQAYFRLRAEMTNRWRSALPSPTGSSTACSSATEGDLGATITSVIATDLSTVRLPDAARGWFAAHHPDREIFRHSVPVNLTWWNDGLDRYDLSGGPLRGIDGAGRLTSTGHAKISRQQIFDLAVGCDEDPVAAQRMLWHAVAWGSGLKPRLNHRRMQSVHDLPASGELLMEAARLATVDPVEAYALLYPGNRTAIGSLGPAFFTKYLYFAGRGAPQHPCLILDRVVSDSLKRYGWASMVTASWAPATYGRYLGLVSAWQRELDGDAVRLDMFEKFLFSFKRPSGSYPEIRGG